MRMRVRKYICVGWLVLLLCGLAACGIGESTGEENRETVAVQSEGDYFIELWLGEDVSADLFEPMVETLTGRLDVFFGPGGYTVELEEQKVNLYVPYESITHYSVAELLRWLLARPTELYIYNSSNNYEDEIFFVERENLESISVGTDIPEGIDPVDYGLSAENWGYVKVVLDEDFARENAERIEICGESLGFLMEYQYGWYSGVRMDAIAEGDGRTFYIYDSTEDNALELLAHTLQQEPMEASFSYQYESPIVWEKIETCTSSGENQCNAEEITGDIVRIVLEPSLSYCAEEEWTEAVRITKKRLDAFKMSYAIGKRAGETYSMVIKCSPKYIGNELVALLTQEDPFYLWAGLEEYHLTCGEYSLIYEEDAAQGGVLKLDMSDRNKDVLNKLSIEGKENDGELVFGWKELYLCSTRLEEAIVDGQVTFDISCFTGEKGFGEEADWLLHVAERVYQGGSLPIALKMTEVVGKDAEGIRDNVYYYEPSYDLIAEKYQKQVRSVYPNVDVNIDSDGTVKVYLHLEVTEQLPAETAEIAEDICEMIRFEGGPFETMNVYPIDTEDGETAEVEITKVFYEGQTAVRGDIYGGRLSAQAELWKNAVNMLPFFTEHNVSYYYWYIY